MPPARRRSSTSAPADSGLTVREAWLAARPWLKTGKSALDRDTGQVGVVQQIGQPWRDEEKPDKVWLRPPRGGLEWIARADAVQQVPAGT